jgi:hypothetical protein
MMRCIFILLFSLFLTAVLFGQDHNISLSTGYVNKGYLNTTGHGFNVSAAYSYQAKDSWRFRVQLLHSNSYSGNYQPPFTPEDIVDAATIMRVTDFPEDGSGQELHPVFLQTDFYLNQDAIVQLNASPEYGHDRAVFFIADYHVLQNAGLNLRFGAGTGVGFAMRQERMLSFSEDVFFLFFVNDFFYEVFHTVRYFYWGGYLDAQIQYELKGNSHLFARAAYFCELPRVFDVGVRKAGTLNVNLGIEFAF